MRRIETEWFALRPEADEQMLSKSDAAQQESGSLTGTSGVFAKMSYFFSDEYSMLDVTLAPLLWRLRACGILQPSAASPVFAICAANVRKTQFQASLSGIERKMAQ